MPGAFSHDLTLIEDAEVVADYSLIGGLKTARALNDDYKIEGVNAITFVLSSGSGVGTIENLAIVPGAPVDFSASAAHFYQWIKVLVWPSTANHAAGGLRASISSDAPPTAVRSVLQATVTAGGSNYAVNDELTLVGGTQTQAAVLVVTAVSGGAVTAVTPKATARGMYTALPANPISTTTGGSGTGCTLNVAGTGNPPTGWIYTATNTKEWFVGGPDTVLVEGWVCYVVDINGTPDLQAGTPDISSVDRMGLGATLVAVGKVVTHAYDVSRYGTGITVNDGTSGSPVTLADVLAYDNANARALGVLVSQSGVFFAAGKLYVGTTGQTAVTVFRDGSKVMVYQGFPVALGFYEITLAGASGFVTTFQLGTYEGGLASGGVVIRGADRYTHYAGVATGLVPAVWTLTAGGSFTVCLLYGCAFSEMRSAALNAASEVRFCTFQNFGTITPGGGLLDNCTFQDLRTAAPIGAAYAVSVSSAAPTLTNCKFINCATAVLWDVNADTDGALDGSEFVSGGSGHAIEFGTNTPGDPTEIGLTDVLFSGYGADDTADAAIYNNSGKHLIINVLGTGSTPTVRNGAGASTTVVSGQKTLTLTGLVAGSEVRIYTAGTTTERAGVESSGTTFNYVYTFAAADFVDIVVLALSKAYFRLNDFELGNADATLPISLQPDRQYANP